MTAAPSRASSTVQQSRPAPLSHATLRVIGATTAVSVSLVGQLLLVEIVLGVLLVERRFRPGAFEMPLRVRAICRGAYLYSAALLVSDLSRHSSLASMAKGQAAIYVTVASLVGLLQVVGGDWTRCRSFMIGVSFGAIASAYLTPTALEAQNAWKYGASLPIGLLILGLVPQIPLLGRPWSQVTLLLVLAAISLGQDTRSAAVYFVVAAVLVLTAGRGSASGQLPLGRTSLVVLVLSIPLLAGLGPSQIIQLFGSSSLVQKQAAQSSGKFGAVLGGRGELVFGVEAVEQSPFVGYGSDPKLTTSVDDASRATLANLGYAHEGVSAFYLFNGDIPTHSYLLAAMVSAGIWAILFWYRLVSTAMAGGASALRRGGPASGLVLLGLTSLLWDVSFSPYGLSRRILTVSIVALALTYAESSHAPT